MQILSMASQLAEKPSMKNATWVGRRNVVITVVFMLQVQLILGMAVFYRKESFASVRSMETYLDIDHTSLWRILIVSLVSGAIVCVCFLVIAIKSPRHLVDTSFWVPPATMVLAGAVVSFTTRNRADWESAMSMLKAAATMFSILYGAYIWCRKQRSFAESTVQVALTAVRGHPRFLQKSIIFMILHNIWLISWAFAGCGVVFCWARGRESMGPRLGNDVLPTSRLANQTALRSYAHHDNTSTCGALYKEEYSFSPVTLLYFLAISVLWTHQTLKSVLQTATALTLGLWWKGKLPTSTSIYSSLTMHVGALVSECFCHPFLRLLRPLVHKSSPFSRSSNERRVTATTQKTEICHVDPIRQATEYTSSWSFLFLGIYGHDCAYSSKRAVGMFRSREWTHLLEENSLTRFFLLFNFAVAITSGCLAWTVNFDALEPAHRNTSFVAAFLMTWVMSSLVMTFVEAATRTMIICITDTFPEDDFKKTRMAFELKKGWIQVYPDMWTD